jgi:type IX secretion system PorP/SprF family membrane protein
MMKKLYILLFSLVFSTLAFSQQESHFTNFMNNYMMLNPGYAGARGLPSITLLHRSQWMGFEGAPTSQVLSFNSPFFNKSVGFGVSVFHRTAGLTRTFAGSLAYSYDLKLTKDFSVRIGLQGSLRHLGIDFGGDDVILRDYSDPSTSGANDTQQYTGNFGAGLFASYKDYYFGFSVPAFLSNEIGFNSTTQLTATEKPHYYMMAGGIFRVNDNIRLRPALLGKYVENAPLDLDINLSVLFQNEVSVGLSYRTGGSGFGESLDLLLFYQANRALGIGMAYDFTLSDIARQQSGSFEALLRFDIVNDRADLTNPRFF